MHQTLLRCRTRLSQLQGTRVQSLQELSKMEFLDCLQETLRLSREACQVHSLSPHRLPLSHLCLLLSIPLCLLTLLLHLLCFKTLHFLKLSSEPEAWWRKRQDSQRQALSLWTPFRLSGAGHFRPDLMMLRLRWMSSPRVLKQANSYLSPRPSSPSQLVSRKSESNSSAMPR